MNQFKAVAILTILLIGSNALSYVFYDFWGQEKDKVSALQTEIKEQKRQIEALKTNKDENLNVIGSEFVKTLFTYDSKKPVKAPELAQKMTIGEAKDKLTRKPKETEFGEMSGSEHITSTVEFKNTHYNKISAEEATVTILFEQLVNMDGNKAKVLNQIEIEMKYVEDEWKIANYNMQQIL